jgi:hypothetical protein
MQTASWGLAPYELSGTFQWGAASVPAELEPVIARAMAGH